MKGWGAGEGGLEGWRAGGLEGWRAGAAGWRAGGPECIERGLVEIGVVWLGAARTA